MKITAINGSPKGELSNSREVIKIIQSFLPADIEWKVCSQIREQHMSDTSYQELLTSDVLLVAFPLYVDGLPASLMHFLSRYEKVALAHPLSGHTQRVFAVANCGFYEGAQNEIALRMMEHFCESAGLIWCGGVGIGTGEMILEMQHIPAEAGIRKPVVQALRSLSDSIRAPAGRMEKNIYTQHHFPWILYKIAGEYGWNKRSKKNGLKKGALNARPLLISVPENSAES